MKLCFVETCEGRATRKGLCEKHYWRVRRHGDTETVLKPTGWPGRSGADHPKWVGEAVGVAGAHSRVYSVKGRASDRCCIACGGSAEQWAYQYNCPNEKQSKKGPYSDNVTSYEPMCRSCHKLFDNKMSGRKKVGG